MAENSNNPYDINGQHFNPDMYFQKLLKECTLKQIMDHEAEIIKNTQILHSDMQTLVYENYNKFISATDTIRKMKTDFKKMEDSMNLLAKNMDSITSFSEQISSTLQGTRQQIAKLSSVHTLLKKLQFLFKLPGNLKDKINEENYAQAVQDYIHAQRVLNQYGNMPSFQGIQKDCEDIVEELKSRLRMQFHKRDVSTVSLAENVDLLLQLKEPADSLCAEFLTHADGRLVEQLDALKDMYENDIVEFVDMTSSGFLSDLCLIIASYNDMFINQPPSEDNEFTDDFDAKAITRSNNFVMKNMKKYFDLIGKRVESVADTAILVKALDKFHRRLQAMNMLCKDTDFARTGTNIVINVGRKQCRNHLDNLKSHLSETLVKVRQILTTKASQDGDNSLAELQALLIMPTIEKIKGVLQDLLVFLQPDLSFSLKTQFLQNFCVDEVREGLVVGFLHHLVVTASEFFTGSDIPKFSPTLLLLLSKMCIEYKENNVKYLLTTTDNLFNIEQYTSSGNVITTEAEICDKFQEAAQNLLNHYVRIQGLAVSQMLRKSVETRDWLHTIEPRTVRAVMKRVVEDVTLIDTQVAALYDDSDGQVDRSSDSSRKTHSVSVSRHHYRSIPTKDTVMKNLNISIEEEERTAQYFHFLLNKETDRLTELCEKWMKIMVEAETTENEQWEINQVIEQTYLLINRKFDRFRKLITNCETGKGEMLITCKDLQGFWDMMYVDIKNCDLQFEKLRDLCSQDKKENMLVNRSVTKKTLNSIKAILIKRKQKMIQKIRNSDTKSKLESNLYQTLGDKYEKNISSGIKHKIKAIFDNSNKKKLSLVKHAKRLSLLQKVQLSETLSKQKPCSKTIDLSEIYKTPEVQLDDSISYINSNQTPGKSILKQPKNSPKMGCLMKLTNKVNFDDHIVLNEVPIDEETEVKLSLAAALSRIDNFDLDSSNEVTAFRAERKLFFDDVRSDEHKDDIKENSKENKIASPRTQMAIAFQELNNSLGTPQERSTREQNFVDKNAIPNQTLPFNRNIFIPIKENKDVETVNTLKQKHIPINDKKEINDSDENIRILRNRTIISMDTPIPKKRSFSKMSMDIEELGHKENESPLEKKRRTSSFKINIDNSEKMNIDETNNNKGRSIKNVKFSGKEHSAERNRSTLSMTSRVQRCKTHPNKYIPIEDSISLKMRKKTPERIRRSRSKIP